MKRSTKHQFKKVQFAPLNGGVNVAQVPEQIAENEMQECQNFWYAKDSMRLVGRGGLSQLTTFPLPSDYTRGQRKYAIWATSDSSYGSSPSYSYSVAQDTGVVTAYLSDSDGGYRGITIGYLCIAVQ